MPITKKVCLEFGGVDYYSVICINAISGNSKKLNIMLELFVKMFNGRIHEAVAFDVENKTCSAVEINSGKVSVTPVAKSTFGFLRLRAIDALSKDVISLLKKNLSNPYPHLEEDEFQWAWNQKLSKYLEVNWYK